MLTFLQKDIHFTCDMIQYPCYSDCVCEKGVAQLGFWKIRQPILHKIRFPAAFGSAGSGDGGLYAACGAPAVSDGHQRHQPGGTAGGRADAAL